LAGLLDSFTSSASHFATYRPVPDSDTLSGVVVAFVAILSFADLLPAADGLNATVMAHDAPADRDTGQLCEYTNQFA